MSDIDTDSGRQQPERFNEPSGGPVPTGLETAAADRSRSDVDLDEHYTETTDLGKHVEGEGDILPSER